MFAGTLTVIVVVGAVSVTEIFDLSVTLTVPESAALAPPELAVTVAAAFVVSCVMASPLLFDTTVVCESVPAVVLKLTGTPSSPLPCASCTFAVIVAVPPDADSACGFAVTAMWLAPAAPIATVIVLDAAPEIAVIVAVPDRPSAMSLATALPSFVCASAGSMRPSDVVKVTCVPF